MSDKADVALDVSPSSDRKASTAVNKTETSTKKPELDMADKIQNEFGNCCEKYEYCGEVFKHEIHWTEWLFFLLLVTSVILFVVTFMAASDEAKKPIKTEVFGILIASTSFIALVFLWNIAKTKTLASLARRLKGLVTEAKANTKKHEENNKILALENEKIQQNLSDFKNSVGLVDSAVKDIDQVETKLNELLKKHHNLVEEQKKFDLEHEAFLSLQERNRLYLKKEQAKSRVRDQFSYADMNRDGAISTQKEKEKMKEYVEAAGFRWSEDWDKDGDGSIRLWELMVQLDKQTDSNFSFERVKQVVQENKKLDAELSDRRAELEKLGGKPKLESKEAPRTTTG
jgi:hypothetical protein